MRFRYLKTGSLTCILALGSFSPVMGGCSKKDETMAATGGAGGAGPATGGENSGSGGGSAQHKREIEQPLSPFIVVDQFGYLPDSEKIAVIRDPEVGFDAAESFTPGSSYRLIDADSGETVLSGTAAAWNNGAVHEQSGDRAFHFDFSEVTSPGEYYVLDEEREVRSDVFVIGAGVYQEVLKHAVRTFFYQRAGFEKNAEFAGEAWADTASHMGPGQNKHCRPYDELDNVDKERDLSGGWYDAGDYNKYTAWTADYITTMARAYLERPQAFSDDYGLPESGNGVADLIDEMRFGVEHLLRLQEAGGELLSIVDMPGAAPPSAATGATRYGPATTNATIRGATAYAMAALVFKDIDSTFADTLAKAAEEAWTWALANPDVSFMNNISGQNDLGAGQQQSSDDHVHALHVPAAIALYAVTGKAQYKAYAEDNFETIALSDPDTKIYDLFQSDGYWLSGYDMEFTDAFLQYSQFADADPTRASQFLTLFKRALGTDDNLGSLVKTQDPYLSYAADIGWGSNRHKSQVGLLAYSIIQYDLDADRVADSRRAAERYIHYIHGVNPLGLVYLSNMGDVGAASSVTQFYHTWFADGSDWDEVGVSKFGPPPGFLVGGPNANYDWDAQCPGHDRCSATQPSPPYGQPDLKSYDNFNTNWPINSWEVTENSNGYQLAYIRLLSKFVN